MASNVDISGPRLFKKALTFQPKKNRTYIVPTKFGLAFAATVLILFFFAVGYANNLIYLFVFFLIAVALMGTWATNKNIESLELIQGLEAFLYADQDSFLEIQLSSKFNSGSYQVDFSTRQQVAAETSKDFEKDEPTKVSLKVRYLNRGLQKPPQIKIHSDFPFGLLRAWKNWSPWSEFIVFPKLEGSLQLPLEATGADHLGGLGVFREHRTHTSSDPMNRIDWKASARRDEILVKHFESEADRNLNFNWEQTAHLGHFEKRISQLALWIDQAFQQKKNFTLKVGSKSFDSPDVHLNWKNSMKTLALLAPEDLKP